MSMAPSQYEQGYMAGWEVGAGANAARSAMLAKVRRLVDAFAERSREARETNSDVAVAWSEAAADLAEALTINPTSSEVISATLSRMR